MTTDAVRKAVEEGNRRFGAAIRGKDYAGLAALYTEHAKLLPPDAPVISGRNAVKDFWASAVPALGLEEATLETVDLEHAGEIAYETGKAVLELGTGRVTIKYLVVWRKGIDGSWLIHRDIWNGLPAS